MWTITSLKSGLPRRETCTHGPLPFGAFPLSSRTCTLRRLAPLQMPRTAFALIGSLGVEPSLVSIEIGTLMAIVWMFRSFSGSTPGAAPVGIRWRFWNGRRAARSKTEPRSTKKPSFRWPAKTVSPDGR